MNQIVAGQEHLHFSDCPLLRWFRASKSGMYRNCGDPPDCHCMERAVELLKAAKESKSA